MEKIEKLTWKNMQQITGSGLTLTQLKANNIEVESKFHNNCSLFLYLLLILVFFGDFGAFGNLVIWVVDWWCSGWRLGLGLGYKSTYLSTAGRN